MAQLVSTLGVLTFPAEDHILGVDQWTLNLSPKSDVEAVKSAKKWKSLVTRKSYHAATERYEALHDVPARCRHPEEAEAGHTGKSG